MIASQSSTIWNMIIIKILEKARGGKLKIKDFVPIFLCLPSKSLTKSIFT